MTSKDKHQKHVSMTKPKYGEFGRNELAIMGTSCGLIQEFAAQLAQQLSPSYGVAYVDKEHGDENGSNVKELAGIQMLERNSTTRLDIPGALSAYERRAQFNRQDLVLINGNHFLAKMQVLVIDPVKSLEKKLDRLTDVKLILLKDATVEIPDLIKENLEDWQRKPVFVLTETNKIADWIQAWMEQQISDVKGLVLAGGESKRMQKDKGELVYHGSSQREHVLSVLEPFCSATYLSCNAKQAAALKGQPNIIEDTFTALGPMGGILSAFRLDPNAAWLTLACDLPYLSEQTLQYLLAHRNPSKVATAFLNAAGEFPEPLVTLWEPRAYPILLNYLSQGYSCPRKVLINTDIEVLKAPDSKEFYNVNHPEEYEQVVRELSAATESRNDGSK